jgi:hypothetical protein
MISNFLNFKYHNDKGLTNCYNSKTDYDESDQLRFFHEVDSELQQLEEASI